MTLEEPSPPSEVRLRALPVQVVGATDGVVLVRGCTEVQISGPGGLETVKAVLGLASGEGATRRQIADLFPPGERPRVEALLAELFKRRILVEVDAWPPAEGDGAETPLELFYWHFGERAEVVTERLSGKRVVIVGVNFITRQLAVSLRAAGVSGAEVVDYHLLRNTRLFDASPQGTVDSERGGAPPRRADAASPQGTVDNERGGAPPRRADAASGGLRPEEWPAWIAPPLDYDEWAEDVDPDAIDCVVAASDFGGPQLLREWNEFCVTRGRLFLPVVLDRLIGSVGPLVVPGETACYECVRARENSHLEDAELRRSVEAAAPFRQSVTGFHPSMASILAEVAHLELTKLFSEVMPSRVGRLIEVNLLTTEMKSRRVLKLPRCPVCSAIVRRSAVNLDKNSFVPGHPIRDTV